MTETKTKTPAKPRQRFLHPALADMDLEKRALRTVLKAIHGLQPDTKQRVLSRAIEASDAEDADHGAPPPSLMSQFGDPDERT